MFGWLKPRQVPPKPASFYIQIALELSSSIIDVHKNSGVPYVYALAIADALEGIVLPMVQFKEAKNAEESAEVQFRFFAPLIDDAKDADRMDRSLALRLILLRRLGKIYPQVDDIYQDWLRVCFPDIPDPVPLLKKSYHWRIKGTVEYMRVYEWAAGDVAPG